MIAWIIHKINLVFDWKNIFRDFVPPMGWFSEISFRGYFGRVFGELFNALKRHTKKKKKDRERKKNIIIEQT